MIEFFIEGTGPDGAADILAPQQDGVLSDAIDALRNAIAAAPRTGICHVALHIALPYSLEAEARYEEFMKMKDRKKTSVRCPKKSDGEHMFMPVGRRNGPISENCVFCGARNPQLSAVRKSK